VRGRSSKPLPTLLKGGGEVVCQLLGLTPRIVIDHSDDESVTARCELLDETQQICSVGFGARAFSMDSSNGSVNKSIKMAVKSAYLDAVIRAGALSSLFTLDLEDQVDTKTVELISSAQCKQLEQLFEAHPDLDEASRLSIIDDNLAQIEQDFDSKAFALAGYIQNLKLDHGNVKELQERFTKKAKSLEKKISHLSDYLLSQMQVVNRSKLANVWLTLQIRTNPCRVVIEDEALLSDDFKVRETVIKINKSAFSEQLKAGVIVPYAHLEQSQCIDIK
jgi:tellurite resistance protein